MRGKQRKFNPALLSRYRWLRYSVSEDALYCVAWILFAEKNCKENTSITSVKDWDNVDTLIQRHIKSGAKHHSCSVAAESFLSVSKGKTADICMQLNSQYRIQIENNRYILACLIDALVPCGKQNIAIRGHEENKSNYLAILQYRAKSDELLQKHLNDKTKKTRYLSPKIQNELLDMSAEQIRRDIVRNCNNAACFALIADEATDLSTKEQISLSVRFVDRQVDGLADQYLESLNRYGIQVDKIRAQA